MKVHEAREMKECLCLLLEDEEPISMRTLFSSVV